ncbi:MAG: hypothetical protein IPH07_09920 [Deltaproteobacteria bacterium]|nr:hypothetical protein [Deltaproteobacteria bacterium]MBK8718752.1 hypothetical protein [Deltaproteobacteria bacterium]MBP7286462.1 hypothetical protein [Nannocystaceae bacterium]
MKVAHRLALALVLASGCAHGRDAALARIVAAPYTPQSIGPDTRVMLVAGGDDVANFAEEVVRQRKLWRGAGLSENAIACYWAKPKGRALRRDRRQYRRLAPALAGCGEASPAVVLADLAELAQAAPPWLYLYVSGHGVPSLDEAPGTWTLPPEERAWLRQPALALDGDPALRVQETAALLDARRSGTPDAALLFSPATLRAALARLPDATEKLVVLQGCFSGGFVVGPDAITHAHRVTALTAAAADRPSFGCGSGNRTTFWGGALQHELEHRVRFGDTPPALEWHAVHEDVAKRVTRLERALGQQPSRPQFRRSR